MIPNIIQENKMAYTTKYHLTPELRQYLIDNYADTRNEELARHLGCSLRTMSRRAAELGLSKSRQYMAEAQQNAARMAAAANRGCGNRGKENLLRYGRPHQFKAGVTPEQRLGKERNKCRIERSAETRRETIRKERRRILFGLPQRTKLKLTRCSRSTTMARTLLRKAGYIVARGDYKAYVTQATRRSLSLERYATRHHIEINHG